MTERPKVITDLLAVDDTGVVANYIRKIEAELTAAEAERDRLAIEVANRAHLELDASERARQAEYARTAIRLARTVGVAGRITQEHRAHYGRRPQRLGGPAGEAMSTHITQCVVCGKDVYCTSDEHALGAGGEHGEGGCDNPPYIEFCSLDHAKELVRRVQASILNFQELYGAVQTPEKP